MLRKVFSLIVSVILILVAYAGWKYFDQRPSGEGIPLFTPDSAGAYLRRGKAYLDRKEYDQAIADYTRSIALAPGDISARVGRGLAYHLRGERALAEADFRAALALIQRQPLRTPPPQPVLVVEKE